MSTPCQDPDSGCTPGSSPRALARTSARGLPRRVPVGRAGVLLDGGAVVVDAVHPGPQVRLAANKRHRPPRRPARHPHAKEPRPGRGLTSRTAGWHLLLAVSRRDRPAREPGGGGGSEPARRRAVSPCRVRRAEPLASPDTYIGSAGSSRPLVVRSQPTRAPISRPSASSPPPSSSSSLSQVCSCSPARSMSFPARSRTVCDVRPRSPPDPSVEPVWPTGAMEDRIGFSRGHAVAVPASSCSAGSALGRWAGKARLPIVHRLPPLRQRRVPAVFVASVCRAFRVSLPVPRCPRLPRGFLSGFTPARAGRRRLARLNGTQ